jgi:hypothetical protein
MFYGGDSKNIEKKSINFSKIPYFLRYLSCRNITSSLRDLYNNLPNNISKYRSVVDLIERIFNQSEKDLIDVVNKNHDFSVLSSNPEFDRKRLLDLSGSIFEKINDVFERFNILNTQIRSLRNSFSNSFSSFSCNKRLLFHKKMELDFDFKFLKMDHEIKKIKFRERDRFISIYSFCISELTSENVKDISFWKKILFFSNGVVNHYNPFEKFHKNMKKINKEEVSREEKRSLILSTLQSVKIEIKEVMKNIFKIEEKINLDNSNDSLSKNINLIMERDGLKYKKNDLIEYLEFLYEELSSEDYKNTSS